MAKTPGNAVPWGFCYYRVAIPFGLADIPQSQKTAFTKNVDVFVRFQSSLSLLMSNIVEQIGLDC